MADIDCGCHARLQPRRGGPIRTTIRYCPLHAAAPELLQALNNSAKLAHRNTKSHSYWLSFRECNHATCIAAREAIRKAGGE